MPPRLKPAKYDVFDCTPACWANRAKVGDDADAIHAMFESADTDDQIVLAVRAMGHSTSAGAVSRHRKGHLRVHVEAPVAPQDVEDMSDLDILRAIIKKGAQYIPTWKLGPRETMQALDMYYRLTQGSAMADMFAAIAAAANQSEDVEEIDVPAAQAPDERAE